MINLRFYTKFSKEESDLLWAQNVCLDDYDYAIITYDLGEFEETDDLTVGPWEPRDENLKKYKPIAVPFKLLAPKDYTLARLLTGCCGNQWYRIKWDDKDAIIGLAYHA